MSGAQRPQQQVDPEVSIDECGQHGAAHDDEQHAEDHHLLGPGEGPTEQVTQQDVEEVERHARQQDKTQQVCHNAD
jgi:hypothetical protein